MKLSTFLLICFFTLASITSFSQIKNDTLIAFQYYKNADSLSENKKFDESILLLKKALPVYKTAKAWERVASCYNEISINYIYSNALEESLTFAEKALNICETYIVSDCNEKAKAYDKIGYYNYAKKKAYKVALSYHHKALLIREKILPDNHKSFRHSYKILALTYKKLKKFDQTLAYFKKALKTSIKVYGAEHDKVIDLYGWIGGTYLDMEKNDIAIEYYSKFLDGAIKNKNSRYIAAAYLHLGMLYRRKNLLDLALEYYEKALPVFKKENKTEELIRTYQSIGHVYADKREFYKSLIYFKKGLDIKNNIDETNAHYLLGYAYSSLAYVYFALQDNETSLYYNNKTIQFYKKTFGENYYGLPYSYGLMARIFTKREEYDKALTYFNESLKINQKIFGENSLSVVRSYRGLAFFYEKREDFKTALKYYEKGLKVGQNLSNDIGLSIDLHINIGQVYRKLNKLNKALAFFNKAIEYNIKKKYSQIYKDKFDYKHYYHLDRLFRTLLEKAKTLQGRYNRDNAMEDLNKSLVLYGNLDTLVGNLRLSYYSYEDKVKLAERTKDLYHRAIEAQLTKYKITSHHTMLEKVRYYSEKSKSNALKDMLLDNHAKNFSQLPEEILTLEKTLKSSHAYYTSRIAQESSKDSIDETSLQDYETKVFGISRSQDSLTQILEQNYPKYYQFKHNSKIVTVAEIQEKIDKKTTLLEFFIRDSTTYVFTISKNNFVFKMLQTPGLNNKIEAFKQAIVTKDIKKYKQLGNALYQMLIYPIKEELVGNELIIVPDESLWHLNFDLLLTKDETSIEPSELPYLLRDYAITYANSATLLFNQFQVKRQTEKQEGCLAFSFSDSTSVVTANNMSLAALRNTEDDLPGTREEIRAIAEIIDGQYYFGADADEANFKKNANHYKILHLALHGEVDNERPENSKLYFTKSSDTIEDSFLYSHELFALNIPSELTVLSACNTGTGKIAKGEGIMSLGHAFQYAGTKSLLLSSWEVPDETTPQFMKKFYSNLKVGMNKGKALQQAKLQYLEQADIYKSAPFYWGGFYLVGDTAPIDFGIHYVWYGVIGILLLIILVYSIFLYKKSRRLISK